MFKELNWPPKWCVNRLPAIIDEFKNHILEAFMCLSITKTLTTLLSDIFKSLQHFLHGLYLFWKYSHHLIWSCQKLICHKNVSVYFCFERYSVWVFNTCWHSCATYCFDVAHYLETRKAKVKCRKSKLYKLEQSPYPFRPNTTHCWLILINPQ